MHYGWIVVWLTCLVILVVAGLRSITGVILVPLEDEFGWSRSAISLAFAINLTLYGFLGPFIAALMDRIGVRKVMVGGLSIILLSISAMLAMTQIWQFQLLWGIGFSVGSGAFLGVLSATVANRWFEKRRGVALGILTASTAAGQMIFLPLLAGVTEAYSWRTSMIIFITLTVLLIPILAIWMKDRPSEKGLLPYGAEADKAASSPANKKNPVSEAFKVLKLGVTSVPFWLLAASFFVCGASTNGLMGTHFIPFSTHHGIPEVQAAGMLAFMGVFNIIGTVLSGWLTDRFDSRWLLFWYYGLRGISLLFLPYAVQNHSYVILIAFAVFYGLDWIATVPPTIRLATEHFGKERSVVIYGWLFAAHQLGSGGAAYLGGVMFEHMHSYTMTFITSGVLCILATLFVLSVKKTSSLA